LEEWGERYSLTSQSYCREKSIIRNTDADYTLEMYEIGASFEICDDGLNIRFGHVEGVQSFRTVPVMEHYIPVNVGDLFLTAVNAFGVYGWIHDICSLLLTRLYHDNSNCDTATEKLIQTKIPSSGLRIINADNLIKQHQLLTHHSSLLAFYGLFLQKVIEDKEGQAEYSFTSMLNGIDFNGAGYYEEIRQRSQRLSLNEVTVKIRHTDSGTEYGFASANELIIFDLHEMLRTQPAIKKCQNCGKHFIPSVRSDEKYCDYPYKDGKTCKQLGYGLKVNADEILKAYRTIYKTQNARKQRNKSNVRDIEERFSSWAQYAKSQLESCQQGNISAEEMRANIASDSWLKGNDINGNDKAPEE